MRISSFLIAACAAATIAPPAAAQPGIRNAIVYAARAVGETDWHVGSFSLQSPDTNPLTFEIGVFFFRAQGYGFANAVYKTYIDLHGPLSYSGSSVTVIEDTSNGAPASGVDGRVSVYNSGAQTQGVFANRNASIPNWGFRISSSADGSAASGISVKQAGPLHGFHTEDGELGYRFNVTLGFIAGGRTALVHTPLSRISSYTTYNSADSNTTTEFKSMVVVDSLTLTASWIPSPSPVALLGLSLLFTTRRRR